VTGWNEVNEVNKVGPATMGSHAKNAGSPHRNRMQNIEQYARQLLDANGLHDWAFGFDRAKTRCGCCHYFKKKITLSKHYVECPTTPAQSIHNTLLHEIGHAMAGWQAGHGPRWVAACRSIGLAEPTRLCDYPTGAQPKWLIQCPCGIMYRYRVGKGERICGKCQSLCIIRKV
jgi:hypothetical protein